MTSFSDRERSREIQKKAQAAWDRIEALGGGGVWEPEMCFVLLADTAIRDDDLALFADFPFVEQLDLSGTNITDAGLAYLRDLPALESLGVVNTKISAEAIEEFRRTHPTVKVTTKRDPLPKGTLDPFTGKPLSDDELQRENRRRRGRDESS